MKLTRWLKRQVERLEQEISQSGLFESDAAASREDLAELKKKIVIRSFLEQELTRREAAERADFLTGGSFALVPAESRVGLR